MFQCIQVDAALVTVCLFREIEGVRLFGLGFWKSLKSCRRVSAHALLMFLSHRLLWSIKA